MSGNQWKRAILEMPADIGERRIAVLADAGVRIERTLSSRFGWVRLVVCEGPSGKVLPAECLGGSPLLKDLRRINVHFSDWYYGQQRMAQIETVVLLKDGDE